ILAAGDRIAAVRRARICVGAVERRAGRADARLAGFGAVAHRAVGARRPVHRGGVLASRRRVTGIDRAEVAGVAVERRTGLTCAGEAALGAVAHGPVEARRAVRNDRVVAAGHRIARVGGARVAVAAVERGARLTHAAGAELVTVADTGVGAGGPVRDGRV